MMCLGISFAKRCHFSFFFFGWVEKEDSDDNMLMVTCLMKPD